MKKWSFFSVIFFIQSFFSTSISQQNINSHINKQMGNSSLNDPLPSTNRNVQDVPWMLSSIGTINTLIIFTQFPDDNLDTNNVMWPKGKAPADQNNWVNQTWTSNPIQGSLTHYYNEMSLNKFKFIGKTVSVISPHTRRWYLDHNYKRGDIQKEIILQVNSTMDFSEFDNWSLYKVNKPDNLIDMIIFIWRNIAQDLPNKESIKDSLDFTADIANLGGFNTIVNTPGYIFNVDNGARKVCTNYCGLTVMNYLPHRKKTFGFVVHEFAHYLLGDISYHSGFGFWGMLSSFGIKSIVANSFERSRLGWIKLKTIPSTPNQTIRSANLSDYVTTGDAYCLEIDSSSGQYFYLENHQNISYWEKEFNFGNIEKGLYVIRKDALTPSNVKDTPPSSYMRLIPADGRFDWGVDQIINNPWGSEPSFLPVFKELRPDRVNGYHDLDFIPWTWNGVKQKPSPIHFTEDQNGKSKLDVKYLGDGDAAFRTGYNEVFSPWSNPNSYKANRTPTPFGFKIDSLVNGSYVVDIYVDSSVEAPPSKPIGLTVSADSAKIAARLEWQPNLEPDLSFYEISRQTNEEGGMWNVIGSTKDTTYIDNLNYYNSSEVYASYKVRAIDSLNQHSVFSDIKSIKVTIDHNITSANNTNGSKEFKLAQNYPNPFNPTTKISWQLPVGSHVMLEIYDILGREIITLVDEYRPTGKYVTEFNATSLPSGVYFYRIKAGNHMETKKMILLK